MKYILCIPLSALIIVTIMANTQNENLYREVQDLKTRLEVIEKQRLPEPLDKNSKDIIASVVEETFSDKLFNNNRYLLDYKTFFESVDGYAKTGTVAVDENYVSIKTGSTTNNTATLQKIPNFYSTLSFGKPSKIRIGVKFIANTNQEVYLVTGAIGGVGYGFKIDDGTIKGVTHDGSTEGTVTLTTFSAGDDFNLEASYSPSDKIVFKIDGDEVGSLNANLPTPTLTIFNNLLNYKVKTDEDAEKEIQTSYFRYIQLIKAI